MSISTRISYTAEEQTDATGYVLNRVNKWTIDFHFDRRRWRRHQRAGRHHHHGRRGGCFGPFFVNSEEGFVKDVRNIEIIVGFPWRDLVEVCAARRDVECGFHSQCLKFFLQRDRWRLEFELWQMKIDVALFEFCAAGEHVGAELRFEVAQSINLVG